MKLLKYSFVDAILVATAICFTVIATVYAKKVYNAYGSEYLFFRSQLTNCLYNLYATCIVAVSFVDGCIA